MASVAQSWLVHAILTLLLTRPGGAAEKRLCNGYEELCARAYSNVTFLGAHNSPFHQLGNPGSNQFRNVTEQLDDGVRLLQLQVHRAKDGLRMCHSSCTLLDAGLLEGFFRLVADWLRSNPTDVVTVILGNADRQPPSNFTGPMTASGLLDLVYHPTGPSATIDDWPALGEMIDRNARLVAMLDYGADYTAVPWLLDQFAVMWETPFSPTDPRFPCVPQRPPDDPLAIREDRLYMLNNNLNKNWSVGGAEILLPDVTAIDTTNAAEGIGSVGASVDSCTADWGRPPNYFLVDYYNRGNFHLSTVAVAARANGLTTPGRGGGGGDGRPGGVGLSATWLAAVFGGLMLLVLLTGTVYCCCRRRSRRPTVTAIHSSHDSARPSLGRTTTPPFSHTNPDRLP